MEEIDKVEMFLSEIKNGTKRADVEFSIPANANYVISVCEFSAWSNNGDRIENWDTFETGVKYQLYYELTPKEGYLFADEVDGYLNGKECNCIGYDKCIWGSKYFFLDVTQITLKDLPLPPRMEPGEAEIPEVEEWNGLVEITDIRWVDSGKRVVTELEEGQIYYLAIGVKPTENYNFVTTPSIHANSMGYYDEAFDISFDKISDEEAVIYDQHGAR